jgi:hypothetical protein
MKSGIFRSGSIRLTSYFAQMDQVHREEAPICSQMFLLKKSTVHFQGAKCRSRHFASAKSTSQIGSFICKSVEMLSFR